MCLQDGEFIHSFLTQNFLEQLLCARYSSPHTVVSKTEKVPFSWSLLSREGDYTVEHGIRNTILDSGKKIKQDRAIKGKGGGRATVKRVCV